MIQTKQPKITLFSHTKNPTEAVALAVHAWTSDHFPTSPDEMDASYAVECVEKAIKAFHKTALEYVDTVWVIQNCSRSFQQQLTRTRLASYAIQSMRVVTKSGFATNGNYTMPPSLSDSEAAAFHEQMLSVERVYQNAIDNGMSAEDARGMLPMNIHSDITMRVNMNALYHMLAQRLCVNTQWEYRQVAAGMKSEISNKIGELFSGPIDAPCIRARKCPMRDEYCGVPVWQYSAEERIDIYERFISHEGMGREKIIKWSGGETPEYIKAK